MKCPETAVERIVYKSLLSLRLSLMFYSNITNDASIQLPLEMSRRSTSNDNVPRHLPHHSIRKDCHSDMILVIRSSPIESGSPPQDRGAGHSMLAWSDPRRLIERLITKIYQKICWMGIGETISFVGIHPVTLIYYLSDPARYLLLGKQRVLTVYLRESLKMAPDIPWDLIRPKSRIYIMSSIILVIVSATFLSGDTITTAWLQST